MSPAYYNEHDPYCVAWLENLITAGHLPAGDVDGRDIEDVQPGDVRGYIQAHFFAGIGGWPLALRLAGWPDDRPVWTGSCPCQPFSAAGANLGGDDPRHLWPAWFRLIRECRPDCLFGEQVESAVAHGWLDLVCDDLEGAGYATGAVGLPACGVGAPHIRERLWWVADASGLRQPLDVTQRGECGASGEEETGGAGRTGAVDGGLADRAHNGRQQERADERGSRCGSAAEGRATGFGLRGAPGWLADAHGERCEGQRLHVRAGRSFKGRAETAGASEVGFWSACDWLPCRDGKVRPVESGTFPLAYGIPGRVGRLRAYGNAIVAPLAAEFIRAYLDAR